jgi:RNA polymerase sigma factor (TIGR02999 family)
MQADTSSMATMAQCAGSGDAGAHDQFFASLYADLHRLARREVHRHSARDGLGATTLLHEAYLDMRHRDALAFSDNGRFLAYAARAMRSVVIDRVRGCAAQKRGGGLSITPLDTETAEHCGEPELLPRMGELLDELAALEPGLAHLVDLKFFCGFTMAEIADLKNVSERTVQRQWEKARMLLQLALSPD